MNRSKLILVNALAMGITKRIQAGRHKPIKNCLECGAMHQHSNSFCSAECCKKHQERKRRSTQ